MKIISVIKKIFSKTQSSNEATPLVQTRREWSKAIIEDTHTSHSNKEESHAVYNDSADLNPPSENIKLTDSH